MKFPYFLLGCLLLSAGQSHAAPEKPSLYTREARDKVVAAMIATAKQLKPIPPVPSGRGDFGVPGDKIDTYQHYLFWQRDYLAGIAQLGNSDAAWSAAQVLKLDKAHSGHFHGPMLRAQFIHLAALHWVAVGDIARALKLADSLATPELKATERDLSHYSLDTLRVDIWLQAANRLIRLKRPTEARSLLVSAGPLINSRERIAVRVYRAWLLGEAGDTAASHRLFAEQRRDVLGLSKDELNDSDDRQGVGWLIGWHVRAGLVAEAAQLARQTGINPIFDDSLEQWQRGRDTRKTVLLRGNALTPYIRTLLEQAQAAADGGRNDEARRLLKDADTLTGAVPIDAIGTEEKFTRQQLRERLSSLYAAMGDLPEAQEQRIELKQYEGMARGYSTDPTVIARLTPEQQIQAWSIILQRDAEWSKQHPELVKTAAEKILAWQRERAASKDGRAGYPSFMATRALFNQGYDAEAREVARVALQRAIRGGVFYIEIMETMATAKVLSNRSAVGSPDHTLVQEFIEKMLQHAAKNAPSFGFAKAFAQAGLLDAAVATLKASPGEEAQVASHWVQLKGVDATMAWIGQLKDAEARARALVAVAAVLAQERDRQLPEPVYHPIDHRITEVEPMNPFVTGD